MSFKYPHLLDTLDDADPRLDAPSFHRNIAPILETLTPRLDGVTGDLFEVGSGSGQHAVMLAQAFPALTYWPSDPDPTRCASIDAWAKGLAIPNIQPAMAFDAAAADWATAAGGPETTIRIVFCVNVIHIAPWTVAEGLFRGAAGRLGEDGALILYGPFRFHGRHIAPSNADFDESLRQEDPAWGVRDIDELDRLAATHGLQRAETLALPANNHLLIFRRLAP